MRKPLTNIAIKNAPNGKLFDTGGLVLVKAGDAGKWVYRYTHLGKRREMGLGSWPVLSLADARKARDRWAADLAQGGDPISTRNAQREADMAERDRDDPTFASMVQTVFDSRKATLRGGGDRGRWLSPLTTHVIPAIGRKRMSEIHQTDIRDALKRIWHTKHPTAQKAIQRTRIVFREAQLMGFDCQQFTVDAAERMLGAVSHETKHIAATPWQEIPALFQRLDPNLASGLCLRWMILTCVRSDGCRGARLSEIKGNLWTVPADRIKGLAGKVTAFRVPLSDGAMEIAGGARHGDLLFPGQRGTSPISSRGLEVYLDGLGEVGRPHGFRTSFRTWAQDTGQPWEVAETVLGHAIGGKTERTYARSDLLDRRRVIMDKWAAHVTGCGADVVKLRG